MFDCFGRNFFGWRNCNCNCERERECRPEDCFRPQECVHRERFIKETRCRTSWHHEPNCGRDEERKGECNCSNS